MRNFTHRCPKSGHAFSKLGQFFPIFEKEQGRSPLPPLLTCLCNTFCFYTRKSTNGKRLWSRWLYFWNNLRHTSEVLKKILVLNIFRILKMKYVAKLTTIWKLFEHLWMTTSEDSGNKILLFNSNEPPESNLCSFEKIYSQNNIS